MIPAAKSSFSAFRQDMKGWKKQREGARNEAGWEAAVSRKWRAVSRIAGVSTGALPKQTPLLVCVHTCQISTGRRGMLPWISQLQKCGIFFFFFNLTQQQESLEQLLTSHCIFSGRPLLQMCQMPRKKKTLPLWQNQGGELSTTKPPALLLPWKKIPALLSFRGLESCQGSGVRSC